MASPEVVEPSGILDSDSHEELSAPLEGWRKKLMLKKGGTPKKKDVVYVAPDGEEIRNKRQLEKYLKNHTGGPSLIDFDWSTGETPRRSARLSSKGRLSSDSTEAEPAPKRSRSEQDEETLIVVSPRKSSRKKSVSQVAAVGKDEIMEDVEKAEEGDGTAASADAKTVEEEVAPSGTETPENNADGKHGEEGIAITVGEVKLGESAEQVPPTEELTSVGDSADKVIVEDQVSKIEETPNVTDSVIEEAIVVDEKVTWEQPADTPIEVPSVEEVFTLSEGETSLMEKQEVKEIENLDILDVPTTETLDGKDADPLKLKEHVESQGIHALIEEPVLSAVTIAPEQQTEPSLPAAERVGVST